jgi:UDP-sulfoquinovose synthase
MRILVLGADGYLGWPTAMHFSMNGHQVIAADSYLKRDLSVKLDCEPVYHCPNLHKRARIWAEKTGKSIEVAVGDVTDYRFLSRLFQLHRPDAVVHYAEQPSAPFSMIDREKAEITIRNNLVSTLNIVYAIREYAPSCHLVKLGTMGEYGTPNIDIEEGWMEITHKGRSDTFLFPRQASSLYHTTKIQDTDLLWFYVRTWGIAVTDLMQGPVYGIFTDESAVDNRLLPHFHYDEIFGTVLNRFIVQAVCGHPLTVYGKGNQIRGYINLRDTLACVSLAVTNPPSKGELRILNQITEVFSVNELAEKVRAAGRLMGYNVSIGRMENPRVEKEDHYYNPAYSGLLELGLKPHLLADEVLTQMFELVDHHKPNIDPHAFERGIKWT